MRVSATTWSVLSELLDEALDLEPAAREQWIERLDRTQPELAPAVRKLLAAHASSETADVLAQLPELEVRADSAPRVSGLVAGDKVGPYCLKHEIGSGGMADVWLAERADGAFTRDVALKLPLINRLRRDLAQRFARERDILARLEHTHIARLYDAGVSDDGLPYLAMEFVDGQPITAYCDAHRLDVPQRLRLFSQVLEAVQYAHAHLVIHRDLKPSNILVTADGQVRLLDFGIAKLLTDGDATHETQLTQLAGRAMTPDYASPEQIKGEPLSIATDVYSLGVVLYELLAGQRPYRLKLESTAQLEQAIVAAEPLRPSSAISNEAAQMRGDSAQRLARALAGDLDTIVLKALAKMPAARYTTIAELGDDLRRYLAGKPVQARPASWSYRASKFVIRNRFAASVATTITIALISAATVSVWQAQRAREEGARAEEVKKFVLAIFRTAEINGGGDRTTTAVDLLKQAQARLDAAPITDHAIRAELLTTIGSGLHGIGEIKLAASVLAEAVSFASTKIGDHHPITAAAKLVYGQSMVDTTPELALAQLEAAEKVFRKAGNMSQLAAALGGRAYMRMQQLDFSIAIDLAEQAVKAAETQSPPIDKLALIESYHVLAQTIHAAQRKGALEPARRSYMLARELFGDRENSFVLLFREKYAQLLADEGDPATAEREFNEVLRLRIELLGPSHSRVRDAWASLGGLASKTGNVVAAADYYAETVRLALVQGDGKPTPLLGFARLSLGNSLADGRRYHEALLEFREADRIYSAVSETNSTRARTVRASAVAALTSLDRIHEADTLATALLEQPFGNPVEEALIKGRLIRLRSAQGRHAEAEALGRSAVEFFAKSPIAYRRAAFSPPLGAALIDGGRMLESLEILRQARSDYEGLQRNGSPTLADIAIDISRAQMVLGRADAAVAASTEGVAFWQAFDPHHRHTGVAYLWHARALAAVDNFSKATDALRKATDILNISGLPADRALLKQAQTEVGKIARSGRSQPMSN